MSIIQLLADVYKIKKAYIPVILVANKSDMSNPSIHSSATMSTRESSRNRAPARQGKTAAMRRSQRTTTTAGAPYRLRPR